MNCAMNTHTDADILGDEFQLFQIEISSASASALQHIQFSYCNLVKINATVVNVIVIRCHIAILNPHLQPFNYY